VQGRWARLLASLRDAAARQTELHERMWLLNNPWEEDYLHWVGEGDERRLHGRLPPPDDGRVHSTTRGGWCRGLAAEARRARRNQAS
jgi:hypothetical protein